MRQLSVEKTVIAFLLAFICFRIFLDIIYIDEKPILMALLFIALSLFTVAYNFGKLLNKTDIALLIMSALLITYPLVFSQEVLLKQFKYDLKVILVPLVLLACSHLDVSFKKLRDISQIVIPIVLVIFLGIFFSSFSYNISELFKIFDNNPVHPVSQTIAKISFLFFYGKTYILIFIVGVLLLLNVRSNLIPILFIVFIKNIKKYYKQLLFSSLLIVGLLLAASSISSDFISLDDIFSRFITKNRPAEYAGGLAQNISSGRVEIWGFYFNYIADNFTLWNYIFGTGSLEMQGKYPLNAHNDLLNVIVNFGIFGVIVLTFLYSEIYKRLHSDYRNYIAFYFIFVFFTNGIMFHQSNLIFLLYLSGSNNESHKRPKITKQT